LHHLLWSALGGRPDAAGGLSLYAGPGAGPAASASSASASAPNAPLWGEAQLREAVAGLDAALAALGGGARESWAARGGLLARTLLGPSLGASVAAGAAAGAVCFAALRGAAEWRAAAEEAGGGAATEAEAEAEAWAVMPQGAARLRGVLGALAARAGAREAAAT